MKQRKSKRIIASVLLNVLVFFMIPYVSLAEVSYDSADSQQATMIAPRLTYIVDAEAGLAINGATATVDCWVKGHYADATKAKVVAELQVKSGSSWIAYATWVSTQDGYRADVDETKTVKPGNTYRVKATVTVWEGSQSEQLILFTDEVTA